MSGAKDTQDAANKVQTTDKAWDAEIPTASQKKLGSISRSATHSLWGNVIKATVQYGDSE